MRFSLISFNNNVIIEHYQYTKMFHRKYIRMCLPACLAIVFNFSLHRIEEGHVGVYFRVNNILY